MDKKNLQKLNRLRGTIKVKINRLIKAADSFEPTTSPEETSIIIQKKLDIIDEIKCDTKDLLENYLDQPEEVDVSEPLEVLSTMEEEIEDLEVRFKLLLSKCKVNNAENLSVTGNKPKVKIPDLPLPEFSGRYEEYQVFKAQFMSIIGENESLNDTQKLCYLKASLKDEAKLIESTQDTFKSLLSALDTRYENKRAIIDSLINNLLSTGKISDSPKQLRNLVDTVKRNLRALENLKLSRNDLSDALLVNILERKIDVESQKVFQMENKSNDILSLDSFLKFLEDRTRILEGINKNCSYVTDSKFIKQKQNYSRPKSLFVSSNKNKKCVLETCNEFHPLYRCTKFKSLDIPARLNCVKKNNLCIRCLNFHTNKCNSKYNCFSCNGFHNSLIHDSSKTKNEKCTEKKITPSASSPLTETTETEVVAPSVCCSTFASNNNKSIILCTAVVYIKNENNVFMPARAILDSASEINVISSECANSLGLKKEKLFLPISGICGSTQNVSTKVKANLSNLNGKHQWDIELVILPKITEYVPTSKLNISNLKIPKNVQLADETFYLPQKIDLLLGCELFFDFIKADKIRLNDSRLILQETCFGYVVAGSTQTILI